MNLIPYKRNRTDVFDPFRDFADIQKEINDLFDFSLSKWAGRRRGLLDGAWSPAVDVLESKDAIVVRADLPGMKKDEIDVSVENGTLVIRGEKREESERKEKGAVRTERFYGSFHRAVVLPGAVDESKAKASYKNGVLELTLPKREEAKPKQIRIDVN